MIRRSTDTETARIEMDMIRQEAEKKGWTGQNWLRAIKALLTAGGGIVKILGYKGNNAEITAFHPLGHNMGSVLVPVMALRQASRRANTLPSGMYHTLKMVQPWTDAYGTPAQDLVKDKDYTGADGQQMQPLRRRPDYGEREINHPCRKTRAQSEYASQAENNGLKERLEWARSLLEIARVV